MAVVLVDGNSQYRDWRIEQEVNEINIHLASIAEDRKILSNTDISIIQNIHELQHRFEMVMPAAFKGVKKAKCGNHYCEPGEVCVTCGKDCGKCPS